MTDILSKEAEILASGEGFLSKLNTEFEELLNKYNVPDEVLVKHIELRENIFLRYIDNLFRDKQNNAQLASTQAEGVADRVNRITIANNDCNCRTTIANADRIARYQNANLEGMLLGAKRATEVHNATRVLREGELLVAKQTLTEAQEYLVDREKKAYDDDMKKVKAQFLGDVASSAISVDSSSKGSAIANFNNAINALI